MEMNGILIVPYPPTSSFPIKREEIDYGCPVFKRCNSLRNVFLFALKRFLKTSENMSLRLMS
jgi:hypothetical protein